MIGNVNFKWKSSYVDFVWMEPCGFVDDIQTESLV
jgi:hypothetical protein